jgi:nicotinamide mononucleotide (NMN) deamidase PncC
MDPMVRSLIAHLHDTPSRYVFAATGGGAGLASWLLSVPGASRTLLEVVVPYSEQALCDYLAHSPASFCSAETARLMARRALEHARWLLPGQPVAGIACTASLRSDRPKRGEHRFHLAIQTIQAMRTYSLTLTKDARDRENEEMVLDLVLLNAMAEAFGVSERVAVPLLPGEEIIAETRPTEDALAMLLEGRLSAVCVEIDGRLRSDGPRPKVLLPGSFNPIHDAHCALMEAAACLAGAPVAFELSVVNADKPPLTGEEVRRRMAQFPWPAPLWLTRAPTFADKAQLFPGAVFIVGADTAARIVQTRFYGESESQMAEALNALRRRGCRFLVAGRVNAAGEFIGLDDLAIPAAQRDLFAAIPACDFRMDLSSTQLRVKADPSSAPADTIPRSHPDGGR